MSRKWAAPAVTARRPQLCHRGVWVLSRVGTQGPCKCPPRRLMEWPGAAASAAEARQEPGRGLPAAQAGRVVGFGVIGTRLQADIWSPAGGRRCNFALCALVSFPCVWVSLEVAVLSQSHADKFTFPAVTKGTWASVMPVSYGFTIFSTGWLNSVQSGVLREVRAMRWKELAPR